MAKRNSVSKLLPGNELGSVLRETARQARRSTRDTGQNTDLTSLQDQADATDDSVAVLQDEVDALQARFNPPRAQYAQVVTGGGGVGLWVYPSAFVNPPLIYATPVSPGVVPYFCAVANTTGTQTNFYIWNAGSVGVAAVTVNIMAVSTDP